MAVVYAIDSPTYPGTRVCYKVGGWPNATGSDGVDNVGLRQALAAAGVSGTLIIATGIYLGSQLDSTGGSTLYTAQSGCTIRPARESDGDVEKVGTVTISGNNLPANVIAINHINLKIDSGIVFTMPGAAYAVFSIRADGAIVNDPVFLLGNGSSSAYAFDSNPSTLISCTINRPKFKGLFKPIGWSSNYNLSFIVNDAILDGMLQSVFNGSAIWNNPIFINFVSSIFTTTANTGKTVTFNNPIFFSNSTSGSTAHILSRTNDQVWTINNGNTIGNPWNNDSYNFNGCVLNNCISRHPKFLKSRHPGLVVLCVDDTSNIDYFTAVASKIEAYGWRGVMAANYTNSITDVDKAKYLELQRAGHEISCHTRNHTDLTQTTSFTVQKAGETISCDGSKLTTSGGKTYLFSAYNSINGNLSKLRTDLIADGYTCGAIPAYLGAGRISPLALDNFINQPIDSAFTLPVNTNRYWAEEIDSSISDLEYLGINAATLTPPGNNTNAGLRSWIHNNTSLAGARGYSNDGLSSIDIYNVSVDNLMADIGITTNGQSSGLTRSECIKRNTVAALSRIENLGLIQCFLAHNTTEFSYADWDDLLLTIASSNCAVMTLSDAIDYAKSYNPSGDLNTADGLVYTRTLVDNSDYHLRTDSPLLGAGTKITGITKDIENNPMFPPYNIGPYGLSAGALGVASVANDGPPRNNITRLTGESTTINPTDTYEFVDTNAWREVTGWTAGTANFGFDASGVPIPFTGQQLIDAGIGPRLYCGSTWIAGYTVDQENPEQLSSWC